MSLAIFDLDNTLLAGDSDYLWGAFSARLGVVDREATSAKTSVFTREYREGRLDIMAFLAFSLTPLAAAPARAAGRLAPRSSCRTRSNH